MYLNNNLEAGELFSDIIRAIRIIPVGRPHIIKKKNYMKPNTAVWNNYTNEKPAFHERTFIYKFLKPPFPLTETCSIRRLFTDAISTLNTQRKIISRGDNYLRGDHGLFIELIDIILAVILKYWRKPRK